MDFKIGPKLKKKKMKNWGKKNAFKASFIFLSFFQG